MQSKFKSALTIAPYTVKFSGHEITVPVGSVVSNATACGYDDNYRFWQNFATVAARITGFPKSMLSHDLEHYGLNVPAEYCAPYSAD